MYTDILSFEAQQYLFIPPALILRNLALSRCICTFVWFWQSELIFSLCNNDQFIFLMATECVMFHV